MCICIFISFVAALVLFFFIKDRLLQTFETAGYYFYRSYLSFFNISLSTLGIHFIYALCCAFAVNEKPSSFSLFAITEDLLLSDDIHDYHFVSQGKTEIPGVDDGEEMQLTDVSTPISTP